MRRFALLAALAAVFMLIAAPAVADNGKPNFGPQIYADGEAWGTKAVTTLPAPNDNNEQSFDDLIVITNGAPGQLPVGEAAPGPGYNGGRWVTHTATWTVEGPVPVLTSYADVMSHEDLGHLEVVPGSPGGLGAPPDYFECPLLPVK